MLNVGESVEIRWVADDPDDDALVDLVAIRVQTGVEIPIQSGVVEMNGVEQSATWQPTSQTTGTYRIEARISDGQSNAVAVAPGQVQLGDDSILPTGLAVPFTGGTGARLASLAGGGFAIGGRQSEGDTLNFGNMGSPPPTAFIGQQSNKLFFAGYDTNAEFAWTIRTDHPTSGVNGSRLVGLAAHAAGGAVAVMRYTGTLTVGTSDPGEGTFTSQTNGQRHIFMVLDGAGTVTQAFEPFASTANGDDVDDIAFAGTPTGYALVGEVYSDPLVVGLGEPNEVTLNDEFNLLAAWNTDGTLRFAQRLAIGFPYDLKLTANENHIFVCGALDSDVVFGQNTPQEVTLTTPSFDTEDLFIASFSFDGEFEWAQKISAVNTTSNSQLEALDIDSVENGGVRLLLIPDLDKSTGSIQFGAGQANEAVWTPTAEDTVICAAYSADGDFQWFVELRNAERDDCHLAAQSGGDVLVFGNFDDQCDLVPSDSPTSVTTLFSDSTPGLGEFFLARLSSSGQVVWALNDGNLTSSIRVADVLATPGDRTIALGRVSGDTLELGTNQAESTVVSVPGQTSLNFTATLDGAGEF